MLKVRKIAKFVLNLRLDILQTTKARASIFCVVFYLDLVTLSQSLLFKLPTVYTCSKLGKKQNLILT